MALERCPGCRARLAAEPSCLRCGCDLTLVRRAEGQARWLMTSAVQALARGDHHLASACTRAAMVLEATPLAQAVLRSLPSAAGNAATAGRCRPAIPEG